ncbi:SCO6880 family protein [Williamsia herbipolensis]|uniref:SCO6880 family protein n=1 Tax=Williamsia herbipolensis TaxID=1603258 RepID=UPI0005F840EB|nr:SCO6880 family protein [Williamsia herbipolensis]
MAADRDALLLYGRWERPRSTGLFGMNWGVTVMAGFLVIAVIMTFVFTQSLPVTGVLALLSVIGMAPLVYSRGGRTGWEMTILRLQFSWAKLRKQTIYRGGVFGQVPGSARMPGIAAGSHMYSYELRDGRRFGLIHYPSKNHFAISLAVQPQGQERVDQWQINEWVAGQGDFLARLGASRGAVGAEVVVESVPDAGARVGAEVRRMTDPNAPAYAKQVMAETVLDRGSARVRSDVRLTLTFAPLREASSREVADQAAEIGRRVSTLIVAAAQAGIAAAPLSAGELCIYPTRAYNPELVTDLEKIAGTTESDDLRWTGTGPITAEEGWGEYRHNGFTSVSWEMAAPPAGQVPSDTLLPLLAPRMDVPRKRVTIIYRIHSTADAVKLVDNDFREALAAEQSKRGVVSASASLRVQNTNAARSEQARGAGLTRFGMIVTATVAAGDDIPTLRSEIEAMGDSARIGLRRCWGYQAAAFAGSLGIGVVLPEYATISGKFGA